MESSNGYKENTRFLVHLGHQKVFDLSHDPLVEGFVEEFDTIIEMSFLDHPVSRITNSIGIDTEAEWHPSGKKIFFTEYFLTTRE